MGDGPRRAPDLHLQEISDGLMVTHLSRQRIHYLNLTAALVLELCTGDHDPAEITRQVQATFELSAPPRDEVDACLTQLRAEGLVA